MNILPISVSTGPGLSIVGPLRSNIASEHFLAWTQSMYSICSVVFVYFI